MKLLGKDHSRDHHKRNRKKFQIGNNITIDQKEVSKRANY